MPIFTAWRNGLQKCWTYRKVWLWWYLLSLVLAVAVAWPLRNWLEQRMGHSLMVEDMLQGLDYTLLNDFNNAYGSGAGMILDQSLVVLAIFVLLVAFLMGGLLASFQSFPDRYDRSLFWGNSGKYWGRMLRLCAYFLLIQGVVLAIFLAIFLFLTDGLSASRMGSEVVVVKSFRWLGPIYLLVAALVKLWHDYAKIELVHQDATRLYRPMRAALRILFRSFGQVAGLFAINILLLLIVFIGYWQVTQLVPTLTSLNIYLTFFLAQAFIIYRIGWRILHLGSAHSLHAAINR